MTLRSQLAGRLRDWIDVRAVERRVDQHDRRRRRRAGAAAAGAARARGVVATAAVMALARWRPQWIGAGLPLALALMFVAAWFVLDARWQWNLARQVVVTARTYAGKDWREKHLAAEDGPLFEFIEKVRAKLPPTAGARVHGRRRALFPRPRRLSPLSVQRLLRSVDQRDAAGLRAAARATTSSSTSGAASSTTRARDCCAGTAARRSPPRRCSSSPAPRCSGFAEWTRSALIAGLVLPWLLGIAVLRRDARSTARSGRRPGEVAWIVGRRLSRRRVRSHAVDARAFARRHSLRRTRDRAYRSRAALTAAFAWLAWRRDGGAVTRRRRRRRVRALVAPLHGLAGGRARRVALLLAWLVLRYVAARRSKSSGSRSIRGTRGSSGRPRRASGTSWAASFRSCAATRGLRRVAPPSSTHRPTIRRRVPLLQVWTCIALGRWDDSADELRRGGSSRWRSRSPSTARCARSTWRRCAALVGAFLVASLPLANVHVALAGYADLPMAAYYAGRRAGIPALERDARSRATPASRCCSPSPARRSRCPASSGR